MQSRVEQSRAEHITVKQSEIKQYGTVRHVLDNLNDSGVLVEMFEEARPTS